LVEIAGFGSFRDEDYLGGIPAQPEGSAYFTAQNGIGIGKSEVVVAHEADKRYE
jgi:hypothetical protein